ncbi:protease modulator HflK N-terminal domain-containing protein, partial [bacterium]|nr:protease modulator HflK N-terminal domain-containing protein [bacterium]
MPWNNQGGGDQGGPWGQGSGQGGGRGGGSGGPWGQGGGPTPPDLDQAIRQGRDALRRVMPGGTRSGKSLILLLLIFLGIW